MPKSLRITMALSVMATCGYHHAQAFDFQVENKAGITLYYNITGDSKAQLTYQDKLMPTQGYEGDIDIPSSVSFEGKEYSVTSIGEYALYRCSGIESVKIPSTVTSIGRHAMAWCGELQEVNLPSSVTEVSADAFEGCYALESFSVDNGNPVLKEYDGMLFNHDLTTLLAIPPGRGGELELPTSTSGIGRQALGACVFVNSVTFPSGLTSIDDYALYFCNGITEINIPASVSIIGNASLADCFNLMSINVDGGNGNYDSHDGVLYDKGRNTVLQSPGGKTGTLDWPSSVTYVGEQAFFRNTEIVGLDVPEGVVGIGESAMMDCPKLESVRLPSTLRTLGDMAFGMDSALRGLYVGCADPGEIELGEDVFEGVDTESCALYVPLGSKALYERASQWSEFKNITENGAYIPQEIVWYPESDVIDGESIRLGATASSFLPVKYTVSASSSGIASLDGDTLNIVVPGYIYVTAYQPGNNTFLPATPVTHVITGTQAGISEIYATDTCDIRVYGHRGHITVRGADEDAHTDVYDVSGRLVYSGTDHEIDINQGGIYIVRVCGKSFKVAL